MPANHPGRGQHAAWKTEARVAKGHAGGGQFATHSTAPSDRPWVRKGTKGRPDETFLPLHRTGSKTVKWREINPKNPKGEKVEKSGKEHQLYTGKAVPDYAKKYFFHGWSNVHINANPKGHIMGLGVDSKGREQIRVSKEARSDANAVKFERRAYLKKAIGDIHAKNEKMREEGTDHDFDHGDALAIVMHTGIRAGAERDRGGAEQAYGVTNLRTSHVKVKGDKVFLHFVAKKGADTKLPITNPGLQKMLKQRVKHGGYLEPHPEGSNPKGQLFPLATPSSMIKHINSLNTGKVHVTTKDFRTLIATDRALEAMKKIKTPTNEKELKHAKRIAGVAAGIQLGHIDAFPQKNAKGEVKPPTGATALNNYIDPVIFTKWEKNVHGK